MSGEPLRDPDADVRKPDSVLLRGLFAGLGGLFVALAVAGMFLPVLPTVPLLLLAAACFARSSRRIYRWLMEHERYGPHIREWRHHRSIPWRAKRPALVLMAISFAASMFALPNWPARAFMALLGLALGLWLWRLPSRDDPRRPGSRANGRSTHSTSRPARPGARRSARGPAAGPERSARSKW